MSDKDKEQTKELTQVSEKPKAHESFDPLSRKPCFIMVEGDYIGEVYPLDKPVMTVGRHEDCDVVLVDPGISRKHAKIVLKKEGHLLQDLNSTNGTYINGRQVDKHLLEDGDKITFGGVVLKYCYQDEIDENYHKKLRSLAVKDGLTKIYNKRYFEDVARREFSYAARHGNVFCIVLLDIDHFKKINDTYGHQAGDYVLRNLARILEAEVREYDTFARWGGEEFIFLLRNVNLENAVVFAERIRRRIASTPFVFEGVPIKVTISLGVAAYRPDDEEVTDIDYVIKEADKYLYVAKDKGRNRVSSELYE